jgi:acyl-CoA hydrolase
MVDEIARALRPGARVVVADGAGGPQHLLPALTAAAERAGPIDVLLGWCFETPCLPSEAAIASFRGFVASNGAADAMAAGDVAYVPVRLSALPALFAGPWRPDLLLAAGPAAGDRRLELGSESSWIPAAAAHARHVLVHVDPGLPRATRSEAIVSAAIRTISTGVRARPPAMAAEPCAAEREIAARVVRLLPDEAWIQIGPGALGRAVLEAIERPVTVWSGVLTPEVVDLAERGLLRNATGSYLLADERLWSWADGRGVLDRVERTHNVVALASRPFVAVNTALQVDLAGQVGVERAGGRPLGAVGGHPDFALAGSIAPSGLSIVALPTSRAGHPTLVRRLDAEVVTTARYDVDVLVTERGMVDLRGLDERERARGIAALWA